MDIVKFVNVDKIYPLGKVQVNAVKNVSFKIEEGDFAVISGPSGSGKSTILNMIGLIDVPSNGKIIINNNDIYNDFDLSFETKAKTQKVILPKKLDEYLTTLRRTYIGYIFQNFNLIPVLNVRENIEFPLLLSDKKKKNDDEKSKEWIEFLIDKVGLTEYVNHKPNELSGGQRQRVAIARSLVTNPKVVLADEPTANLDSKTSEQILDLIQSINKETKTTFIFSTHDQKIVKMANHVIYLLDGQIDSEVKN